MSKCCGDPNAKPESAGDAPCAASAWFDDMVGHCLDYATGAKQAGRPIVGIMCEFTPREIILAAGAVPVCLCGGSAEMVPPAEEELPANLCPLIKSTYGYHVRKANPFLEMADLLVAETTCDGKKKMYELLGRTRPMYVLELPQKPDDPDAMAHWAAELRKFRADLECRFGVEISDEKLRDAIGEMNRERLGRRRLAELMKADAPPLTGRELLNLKSLISCIPEDLAKYEEAIEQLTDRPGPDERAASPGGAARAKRVRVLMTGVPMAHEAERVLDIVEDSGGLVVAMESCTGVKPIYEDVDAGSDDPLTAIAEKYFHLPCSVMTPNEGRLELLRELAGEYRPQCVIELIWQACLTYDVESARVRRLGGAGAAVSQDRDRLFAVGFRPDRRPRRGAVRDGPRARRPKPMKTVLHTCPFVPPEWVAAHGLSPMRITPAAAVPRPGLTAGVCPFAGAFMAAACATVAGGIVVTTVCDQMRRAAELIQRDSGAPVFLMNVPATWQTPAAAGLYRRELERLGRYLVGLGGRAPSQEELAETMLRYERKRGDLRAAAGGLSPRGYCEATAELHRSGKLPAGGGPAAPERAGTPLAIAGGPMRLEDFEVFDLIEQVGGRIVLDATASGEMTMPGPFDRRRIRDDPVGELVDAWFGCIPHAMRRPNSQFYDYLRRELPARGARGVLYRHHTWCDTWRAEAKRLADWCPVPVLDLAVGDDPLASSTAATRIQAFVEMLQ